LLRSGGALKVLTSSREPLHVPGETSYRVLPLVLPDPRQTLPIDALLQCEAVHLFVDRALAVLPSFKVTARNAPALIEICQRLDGIPLAIELAAARVRALSVESIVARLGERFQLLKGGSRTVLPRQQTLRALIDWSFDLLTEPERALLRRLAVFAGGWTLEGVTAVADDRDACTCEAVDLLTGLVDKSLVVVEAGGERYRLLETVREYALERLHDSGEGDVTRTRHLEFYLALAARAAKELWGVNQGDWVVKLDTERENVLAAHAWCDRASGGGEKGLLLVSKLQLYWLPSGSIQLGYRITLEALARPGAQKRDEARVGALYAASQLAFFMGRFQDTQTHGQESLMIAREIGDDLRAVDVLLMLGYAADNLEQRALAREYYAESIDLARKLGNHARLSYAFNALAGHHQSDDPATAAPLYEQSLALAREVGDQDAVAVTLQNLARTLVELGRADQACKLILESLDIARQIGAKRPMLDVLHACAALAAARAEWSRAVCFLTASGEELRRLGIQRLPYDVELLASIMPRARDELGPTDCAVQEAAGRALSHEEAVVEARRWLASGR
jgi:non-specific serine/threonine protein kinase